MVSPAGANADVGAFQFTRWVDIRSTRIISLSRTLRVLCTGVGAGRPSPNAAMLRVDGAQRRSLGSENSPAARSVATLGLRTIATRLQGAARLCVWRLFELPGIANGAA